MGRSGMPQDMEPLFTDEEELEGKSLPDAIASSDGEISDLEFSGDALEGFQDHVEFERRSFHHVSFAGTEWARASFEQCCFSSCDFSNAHMPKSFWRDCQLTDCRLVGADMHESYMERVRFKDTLLSYANLSGSKLSRIRFASCALDEASLDHLKLRKLALEGCDLTRAELFGTLLKGIDLSTSKIEGIRVSDRYEELKGTKISLDQAPLILGLLGIQIADL